MHVHQLSLPYSNRKNSFTCSLGPSTCVLLVNTSQPAIHVEPQHNMTSRMGRKNEAELAHLRCRSTCLFIIFHPRHVAVLLTRRTGKTLLRHITLKQQGSTTDLAHSSSAFLQLPCAAQRPRYGFSCMRNCNTRTLLTPSNFIKRGLILSLSELQNTCYCCDLWCYREIQDHREFKDHQD